MASEAVWAGEKRTRLKVRGPQAVISNQLDGCSQVTELHWASGSAINKAAVSYPSYHDSTSACPFLFLSEFLSFLKIRIIFLHSLLHLST